MTATETGRELRITFRQYDGEMLGTCWCGLTSTSAHPRTLWEWLDDHEHAVPEQGSAVHGS
ncbi:hypothetical protein [Planosporangium mesophilum]|uniref:Uncharacterized protein n=1 Tax=Planosporangium mesophilum TaxID=689768 RepID=A0A8J3X064_9ACTN|nr:hypothetical protein [Planosporangium mesophilum]NJC84218.1 hypothetical protein [Planosporangium mesophilum]GII23060.1 hypothetical protein Pme01_26570 [Planosporangium mesophilum]